MVIPFAPLLALLVRLRRGGVAGSRLTLAGGTMVVLLAVSRLFWWASQRCVGDSGLSKFVRREWVNRAKASTDGLSAAMVVALLWRHSPRWGHH
jgi:ABC-type Na+ efflux pump permease subunit